MKPLTIGDLKKFIEEQQLPDDMIIFVINSYSGGMEAATQLEVEPQEIKLQGTDDTKMQNALSVW